MRFVRLAVFQVVVVLMGCQGPQYTSFAPVNARLEPVPGGGAQYFLLINTSGRELHNVSLSAYLWDEHTESLISRQQPCRRYEGSGSSWPAGKAQRFRPLGMHVEDPITQPVTRAEVVGHCDEGYFRQAWVGTESGQLQPVGCPQPK